MRNVDDNDGRRGTVAKPMAFGAATACGSSPAHSCGTRWRIFGAAGNIGRKALWSTETKCG